MQSGAKRERANSLLYSESNNSLPELTKASWELPEAKWLLQISSVATKEVGPTRFSEKKKKKGHSLSFHANNFRAGGIRDPLIPERPSVRYDRTKILKIFLCATRKS